MCVRPGETLLERLQRLRRRPVSDSSSGVDGLRHIAVMGKPTPRQQLKMDRQWAEEKVIHWLQAAEEGNKTQDVGEEESALRPFKRQKVEGGTGTCSSQGGGMFPTAISWGSRAVGAESTAVGGRIHCACSTASGHGPDIIVHNTQVTCCCRKGDFAPFIFIFV